MELILYNDIATGQFEERTGEISLCAFKKISVTRSEAVACNHVGLHTQENFGSHSETVACIHWYWDQVGLHTRG